ncbi:FHA domain-containing protein [Methylobacterium sp. D48H]
MENVKTLLIAPAEPKTEGDSGKTVLVGQVNGDWEPATLDIASINDDRLRSPANRRLAWPARDSALTIAGRLEPRPTVSVTTDDAATRLVRFETPAAVLSQTQIDPSIIRPAITSAGATADPVTGWAVIVDGPGRGHSFELGVGVNSVGRNLDQKIALAFGDEGIHREKHAFLIYDPKSRRFYVNCGEGRNLTYLNDELVLTPVEVFGGETITVGATKLKFVPFCGPQFGWIE